MEINYLLGNGRNQMELGLGARVGFVKVTFDHYGIPGLTPEVHEKWKSPGWNGIGTIAYRHTFLRGLMLRAGLNPFFNFSGDFTATPFFSIGHSF